MTYKESTGKSHAIQPPPLGQPSQIGALSGFGMACSLGPGTGNLPVALATLSIMHSRDTSCEADEVQREVQRKLGPAARVEMAFAMSQRAREISVRGMMDRDPTLTYSAAQAKLLRRLLGTELYEAAYSHPAE